MGRIYQESNGHVGFSLALLLAKIANKRLKILTSLLFDLQTSVRGQMGKILTRNPMSMVPEK